MSSYTMVVPHAVLLSANAQAAVLCAPCDAEHKLITYTYRYLGGNFAPVKKEVHSEALEVVGALPEGLEGVFARTGPNPEQLAGDYHWCAYEFAPCLALARLWPHQATVRPSELVRTSVVPVVFIHYRTAGVVVAVLGKASLVGRRNGCNKTAATCELLADNLPRQV